MGLFGGKTGGGEQQAGSRMLRHSSGWGQLSRHLKAHESLRFLDIGPTSAGNINFITGLGHSIYMADLVEDAARFAALPRSANLSRGAQADEEEGFDAAGFVKANMDFAGRIFDVVALWDAADYLPAEALQPIIDRLHEVMSPGAQLLALFHSKTTSEDTQFSRYHLTSSDEVDLQRVGGHPILQVYTNRQVETIFKQFSGYKFFLAKDALREVIVTR